MSDRDLTEVPDHELTSGELMLKWVQSHPLEMQEGPLTSHSLKLAVAQHPEWPAVAVVVAAEDYDHSVKWPFEIDRVETFGRGDSEPLQPLPGQWGIRGVPKKTPGVPRFGWGTHVLTFGSAGPAPQRAPVELIDGPLTREAFERAAADRPEWPGVQLVVAPDLDGMDTLEWAGEPPVPVGPFPLSVLIEGVERQAGWNVRVNPPAVPEIQHELAPGTWGVARAEAPE